jgi:hypothetical protein
VTDRFAGLTPYEPPPADYDGPLDPIQQALVRMFVRIIVRELDEEEAQAAAPARAEGDHDGR